MHNAPQHISIIFMAVSFCAPTMNECQFAQHPTMPKYVLVVQDNENVASTAEKAQHLDFLISYELSWYSCIAKSIPFSK